MTIMQEAPEVAEVTLICFRCDQPFKSSKIRLVCGRCVFGGAHENDKEVSGT